MRVCMCVCVYVCVQVMLAVENSVSRLLEWQIVPADSRPKSNDDKAAAWLDSVYQHLRQLPFSEEALNVSLCVCVCVCKNVCVYVCV